MTSVAPVVETTIADLKLVRRGKVRDVYEVDDARLLIVATDRISAFDCILPTQIERKGEVLTALSRFWFERLSEITPHHLITTDVARMPEHVRAHADVLRGRSMLVRPTEACPARYPHTTHSTGKTSVGRTSIERPTEVFPVECVVRGYLAGKT